jgi:hypothetical protein
VLRIYFGKPCCGSALVSMRIRIQLFISIWIRNQGAKPMRIHVVKKKFTPLGPGSSCTKTVRNAFDAGKSITRASEMGLSPENLNFFGLTWQARLTARCNFTGHKKVSISRVQPPPTCPRNGFARIKSITYGGRINHKPYSYCTSLLC